MSCWCEEEDPTDHWNCVLGLPGDAPPEFRFCYQCGRDLRLPVAKVYRFEHPPEYTGNRFWTILRADGRPDTQPMTWQTADVVASHGAIFGPVTVSPPEPKGRREPPADPEEVPE